MDYYILPTINALLNGASALLLLGGYHQIKKRGRRGNHKKFMLTALSVSALFLVSYLVYHYNVGSVKFQGEGIIRTVYFTVLISHTILATVIAPAVIVLVTFTFRGSFARHKRLARWVFPTWLYVSVTGVIIYLMLYRL